MNQLSSIRRRLVLNWRLVIGVVLPFVLIPLVFLDDDSEIIKDELGETRKSTKFRAAYTILIVAVYWMFEVIPLPVTSLLHIVLFPFLGIMDTEEVAPTYFQETNVMLFGGLVLELGVEYCNLHKRIALRAMTIVGSEPIRLLFGVMTTSMFLSMWMSNTASTAMMLPILLAVLDQLAGSSKMPLNLLDTRERPVSVDHQTPTTNNQCPERRDLARKRSIERRKLSQVGPIENSDTILPFSKPMSSETPLQENIRWENIRKMFMFGVAYASNLGGTATITGSGPNMVFQAEIKKVDISQGNKYLDMTFANWMALNVPAALINTLLVFIYLVIKFHGLPNWRDWFIKTNFRNTDLETQAAEKRKIKIANKMLNEEYEALGPMTFHEIAVFVIFLSVILGWMFRDPKFMKGWNSFLDGDIGDSSIAIFGVVLMFLVPKDMTFFTGAPAERQKYEALLDWKFVQHHLPWGVIFLLGGGLALSEGAEKSGLSQWIGSQLTGLENLPRPVILLVVMILAAGLTEVCSNVATANVILPILLQLSKTINLHPFYLSVPATIACSFAFMLPIATPPNALVFSTGHLKITDMVSTGLLVNFACIIVYVLLQISLGELLFQYSDYEYPVEFGKA